MFTQEAEPNWKAAGICYNNIGSIQYKQGKFEQASQNFMQAYKAA
jgi:Tfp pilus assembly protein PilF